MVIDTLENSQHYEALHSHFKTAFDFLKRDVVESAPSGRTEIDGTRLFALLQEYETKPAHEGKIEAHQKYIDIQFILEGEEFMGYAPLNGLVPSQPFDIAQDFGLYEGKACLTRIRKGMFAIFFPQDGHLPGRYVESPCHVKKIVLKVAV